MKLLVLILSLIFLINCGKRNHVVSPNSTFESCENIISNGNEITVYIYPICGDTSIYIKRRESSSNYKREELFKNGKVVSSITFSGHLNHMTIDESFYQNDSLLEYKESIGIKYNVSFKNVKINDTLFFRLQYFENGNIKSYGLTSRLCGFGKEVEIDSLGKFMWTGDVDPSVKIEEVWNKNEFNDSTLTYFEVCGTKIGLWKKYDRYNPIKIIETVEYLNNK